MKRPTVRFGATAQLGLIACCTAAAVVHSDVVQAGGRRDPYAIPSKYGGATRTQRAKACSGGLMDDNIQQVVDYFRPTKLVEADGKGVRIMCVLVVLGMDTAEERARAAAETWLSQCDGALIVSDTVNSEIPTVLYSQTAAFDSIHVQPDSQPIVMAEWKNLHDDFLSEFDYFLMAHGTNYVIVVSLCLMLSDYGSNSKPFLYRAAASSFLSLSLSLSLFLHLCIAWSRSVKKRTKKQQQEDPKTEERFQQ